MNFLRGLHPKTHFLAVITLAFTFISHAEALPELVDKAAAVNNASGEEPRLEWVWIKNRDAIEEILTHDSPATREEMRSRLADTDRPLATRLLYAGILASWNDRSGQTFLLNQGREATQQEQVKDVFWVIGHLGWLYPLTKDAEVKTVDMRWAEDFMLEMLKQPKSLEEPQRKGEFDSRQALAINSGGGNFGEILGKMKSRELYATLTKLWEQSPPYMDRREILAAFDELGDRRAMPLLLEVLKTTHDDDYRYAASALAKFGEADAIPILLEHLDDWGTYPPLSKFHDDRILPAVKKALPSLKDYALGAARLMIIEMEGGDLLPKLIALAKEPNLKNMMNPMMAIRELKDPRAVPFAIGVLNTSPDMSDRQFAIRILAEIKDSPAAIKALINALDIDFNALAKGKDAASDNNKEFREEIATDLKTLTGHDFGVNKKRWIKYFRDAHRDEP